MCIRDRNDGGTREANLDEEMEKVFAMPGKDRFDVADFSKWPELPPNSDKHRYNERDYSCKYLFHYVSNNFSCLDHHTSYNLILTDANFIVTKIICC